MQIYHDERVLKLQVDGGNMSVLGMNWSYVLLGENCACFRSAQPGEIIQEALDHEIDANVIRPYAGVPDTTTRLPPDHAG